MTKRKNKKDISKDKSKQGKRNEKFHMKLRERPSNKSYEELKEIPKRKLPRKIHERFIQIPNRRINKKVLERFIQIPKRIRIKKLYKRYGDITNNNQIADESLSEYISSNRLKILIPAQLLIKAKSKLKTKKLDNIIEAMKYYDIDDDINFEYFKKIDKINNKNYKYLYTLSYSKRIKILKNFNNKDDILVKSSKTTLHELISFLITEFEVDNQKSISSLSKYKLNHFEGYIIPINEGTDELKYYYIIYLIIGWLKKSNIGNVKRFLSYCSNYFQNESNYDDIKDLFFIIFKIDLMFFNGLKDKYILVRLMKSIGETFEEKFKQIYLIKDNIKQNIDKAKITGKTILCLKNPKLNFRLDDYFFHDCIEEESVLQNIVNKEDMSYNYLKENKFNYFDDEKKIRAFISIENQILSSNVIREYYDRVEAYSHYEFPFKGKDKTIIDYLWDKIMYRDLDYKTFGITNREGFGIFINRNKGNKSNGLGYGINIVTISHEFIGHEIRNLINTNNKSLASTPTPDISFLESEDNRKTKNVADAGDRFEIIILGMKLESLFVGGNHFLLNLKNWDLPLQDFQEGFKKANCLMKIKQLKTGLKEIKNDSRVEKLFENINYDNIKYTIDSQSEQTRIALNYVNDSQCESLIGFR